MLTSAGPVTGALTAAEPSGNPDAAPAGRFMKLIAGINRDEGTPFLIPTHVTGLQPCAGGISVSATAWRADMGPDEGLTR